MERVNGRVYFCAQGLSHNVGPWSTDGTPGGTSLVKDIHPNYGSFPKELTVFRGRLWFVAEDPLHGARLWSTEGTGQGTVMLADAPGAPLPGYSDVSTLTVAGDTPYFVADQTTARSRSAAVPVPAAATESASPGTTAHSSTAGSK
jgi:ELWxxDGT repeat protein